MKSKGILLILSMLAAVSMITRGVVCMASEQDIPEKKVPESAETESEQKAGVPGGLAPAQNLVPGDESTSVHAENKEDSTKMNEEKTKKINEAHQFFAIELNNEVWNLLQKNGRTQDENERMIHAAHASCCHWLKVGTGLNHQRGEWLIAHVYTELGLKAEALRHAERCLALTEKFRDLMQDFDLAYAQEAMARANALAGNRAEAIRYREMAEKLGNAIAAEEDRKIFLGDFTGGNWFGLTE